MAGLNLMLNKISHLQDSIQFEKLVLFFFVLGMSIIEIYVVSSNVARFAICVFPTFRLKHLNHILANFDYYGRLMSARENIPVRDGEYYVVRECVIEHQKVISDFSQLKSNTKILFFMDFLTMTIQLAPYPVIIMGTKKIDHIYFFALTCLIFAFSDLFIIYWSANYIVEESEAVQSSVFLSNWHEADIRTKKMLLMMMIRSNRRLALKVGPLYEMDLNIFLRIVKGMYTMITVFRKRTLNL
ncbi:putative odorant receptor 19b [Harmonia axyridis]|uniref:putative odorant receptor 19b n=1 Tax=Harmonia axyridis TaxID=115357 RepID=UPI001E278878|nr:putative odorant receptor 19b [Harmonia axyridis]